MKEPIIVTSFWDVGRGNDCLVPRTNERYYKEFAAWARIRNRLIVYTDEKSYDEIKRIRENYGLLDKTKIIVIKDIFSIEHELYKKMVEVENDRHFLNFRLYQNAMSNKANFNYAWLMIYWCIADSAKYMEKDDIIAWFDFGFNHMDRCYTNMEEFDFLWEITQDISKIQLYVIKDLKNVSLIESLQYLSDAVLGAFCLLPVSLADEFWQLMRKSMEALLMIGCMDDDQFLLHMACKYRPELFEVNISKWWYIALKENGAEHLSVRENFYSSKKRKLSIKNLYNHTKGFMRKSVVSVNYLYRISKSLKRNLWVRAKIQLSDLVKGNQP